MKRAFSIILFTAIFSFLCTSQTYYPFPESNTYWQYSYNSIPMYCPCWGLCYDEQLRVSGDTLINETIYHKLEKSIITYSENCNQIFDYHGYQGAFRNVVESKQVWFVPNGEQNEYLLYDFNLEVGDTITAGYLNPNGFILYVDQIDSVIVGNSFRKRYMILGDLNLGEMPLVIIEGIGGQNLIKPLENWLYFEEGYSFQCINVNDSLTYPDGGVCDLMVKTPLHGKDITFETTPNPTSGLFKVNNPSNNMGNVKIEIFDSFGKRIKQVEYSGLSNIIDLSEYANGLYFLKIKIGRENFSRKIIKQ